MVLTTKVLFYQKVRPGDDASYHQAADVDLWGGLFLTYYCAPVGVTGQIFLSDTLENGAGYATYLGQPAVAEHLLRLISEPGHNGFFETLVGNLHADSCDTSCPDCLRSYSNLQYHNLLDWRLAVDLASLALDAAAPISLASSRWARVANIAAVTLLNARPGYRQITIAGLPAVTNGTDVKIITHPLWQDYTQFVI